MRDFRDAKAMAQTLRETLKTKSVSLTHSESLELVATILGFRDWNVLSATIQSEVQPPANPDRPFRRQSGWQRKISCPPCRCGTSWSSRT